MDMTRSAIIEVEITLFYDVTFVRQRGPSMAPSSFLVHFSVHKHYIVFLFLE